MNETKVPRVQQDGAIRIDSTVDNVTWGRLPSQKDSHICRIVSGEVITVDTVSHEGIMEDQGRDPIAWFASRGVDPSAVPRDAVEIAASYQGRDRTTDGPHVVTGPISVEGAEPGDILKVEFLELLPRAPFGVVSTRHFRGALSGEYPVDGSKTLGSFDLEEESVTSVICHLDGGSGMISINAREGDGRIMFPSAPFLGLIGVVPPGDQRLHSVPPGDFGGNIDVRNLVSGSTLYLPVRVDEAGLFMGDPHYAQGHGEVALTAVEAPLRASMRVSIMERENAVSLLGNLSRPFAESEDYWYLLGMDRDLNEAMRSCVREALRFMTEVLFVPREESYAYLSAASDFVVTQVVDDVKGVHCLIRKRDFRAWV